MEMGILCKECGVAVRITRDYGGCKMKGGKICSACLLPIELCL